MVSQTNLLAMVLSIALGVGLLARAPRNHLYQNFAILCTSIGLLFLGLFLDEWSSNFLWQRLRLLTLAILVPSLLRFFRSFPEEIKPKDFVISPPWLIASGSLVILALLPASEWSGWIGQALLVVALLRALLLLSKQHHLAKQPVRKARLQILRLASAATFVAVLLQQIPGIPAVGTAICIMYLYFLSQALLHYRLLDLKEILGRGLLFLIQAVVLTVVFSLVLGAGAHDEPLQFFLFNALIAASVIVILFEPVRRLCEQGTKRFLFPRNYEFEKLIQQAREDLPGQVTEDGAIEHALTQIQRSGRTTHISIYEYDEKSQALRLRGSRGETLSLPQVVVNPRVVSQLINQPKPLVLENLERQAMELRQKEPFSTQMTFLQTMHAQVLLPMIAGTGDFVGILNLRDRGFEEAYSSSEIRLLMTLAGQLATVLRNVRLYNKILEDDRLMALGEMAAGLAHEIRNPLGAIKGAAQVLQQKTNGSSEQFLGIILEETDRLNRVLEHFLDFARVEKPSMGRAAIRPLLEHTVSLLRTTGLPANLTIELQVADNLPDLQIDAERIKQVFLNLGKNAVEAVPSGGKVRISAARLASGEIEVRFSDSGSGINEKRPDQVFAPFYSTKEKGSGLGLAICQRIILDHGGTIEAIPNGDLGGASFCIRLHDLRAEVSR